MICITEQLLLNELMFIGSPRKPNENKNLPHKTERKGEGGREELEYVYAGRTIVMYLKSKVVGTNFRNTVYADFSQS